jgi:hypothetical protein
LICSGNNVAFGAPRCGDGTGASGVCDGAGVSEGEGLGEEDFFFRCGEPLALGVGVGLASGDSLGLGVGDDFFLRRGEPLELGDGVGEVFFLLLGLGDGDSSAGVGDLFFFGDAVGDGTGDGVGVGDFFFVVDAVVVFFFRCGVGVGVEKIFFSACPRVCSASLAGAANIRQIRRTRARRSM